MQGTVLVAAERAEKGASNFLAHGWSMVLVMLSV